MQSEWSPHAGPILAVIVPRQTTVQDDSVMPDTWPSSSSVTPIVPSDETVPETDETRS